LFGYFGSSGFKNFQKPVPNRKKLFWQGHFQNWTYVIRQAPVLKPELPNGPEGLKTVTALIAWVLCLESFW
jgi:hypothetical protein